GRSIERIVKAAKSVGYLVDFPDTVDFDTAMRLPRDKVMILATGGQGESRAALSRIAFETHQIKLTDGDMVLFSSRQIPGNEVAIGRIQNALAAKNVIMVTDRQADIHVSGHPGRPELAEMYGWIRPQILLPVHGEMRHMAEQARFGLSRGIPRAIVQGNGTAIRLAPDGPQAIGHERAGRLVLDGDVILPADGATMTERRRVANNGYIAVTLASDASGRLAGAPSIQIQGVPVEEDREDFLDEAADAATEAFSSASKAEQRNEAVRLAVRRAAAKWTGKKPVVQVSVIEV
ncbi:MAG: MBL fold metallo-hydrolase RNA specificity domain-containing protein, partial [Sphingomonadaceae bacterium]